MYIEEIYNYNEANVKIKNKKHNAFPITKISNQSLRQQTRTYDH